MFQHGSFIHSILAVAVRLLLIAVVVLASIPQTGRLVVAARADEAKTAQTPADTAPAARTSERPVERWFGTTRHSRLEWGPNAGASVWPTPGIFDYAEAFEWNIEVYTDGYARANVKWTIERYSYTQSELTTCHSMMSGGTDYQVENCQYSTVVEDGQGEFLLEGTRDVGPDGKPRITWQRQIRLDDLRVVWSAEGTKQWYRPTIWVEGPMRLPNKVIENWGMDLSGRHTFYLEPGSGDRAPRAVNGLGPFYRWVSTYFISVDSGYLTGIVEDPTLNLDKELLENSTFLAQVPIDDLFTANVEWNSTDAGTVAWQLGAAPIEQVGPTRDQAVPKIINVGSQPLGVTPLTAQAKNTLGKPSKPETTSVAIAPPPGFAGGPASISGVKIGDVVKYKHALKFPDPAFKAKVNVPSWVPFFGGKPLGIAESQVAGEVEVLSSGGGSLKASGQTGLEVAGGAIVGRVGAQGNGILDRGGWRITDASLQFSIGGKIKVEEPLLKAIPALLPALTAIERVSQKAADFIKSRAKAVLELLPRMEAAYKFASTGNGFEFKSGETRPVMGFKTYVVIQLIEDLLKAGVGVGGEVSIAIKVPAPYFKEAALKGLAFAKIVLGRWAWEGEKSWSAVISGAGAAATDAGHTLLAESASGEWRLSDRDYLNRPDYAQFVGEHVTAAALDAVSTADGLVIRNIYPQADPAYSAQSSNSARLLWVHDRPDLPAQSAGEIVWSYPSNNTWVTSINLTNDDLDDWNPQLISLPSGEGVAVWQRMDVADPGDLNTDPASVLSHMQIAARVVSTLDRPLVQLSAGGSLNHRPMLASTTQGALAVWVNNPANQLIGTAAAPDRVVYATFAKSTRTWSAPAQVLGGVADMLSFDLAASGNVAALVYQRDMDGDILTEADQELFYMLWQNGVWGAPVQLTNNAVPDEAPELALAADGSPSLAWRQNSALVYLEGAWGNAPQSLALPDAVGRLDYQLARGSYGELALTWQQSEGDGTGLGYAIYDSANRQWGGQGLYMPPAITGAITPTIGAVTYLSPSFVPGPSGPSRSLAVAYLLAQVESVTRTVEGVAIPNIPMPTQYDLRVVSLPLDMNLSIATPDLTTPNSTTIQAAVRNTGQLAAVNVPIVLATGSTGLDYARAMTQTLPVVRGGQTVTATFSLPEALRDAGKYTVIVAPGRVLTETTYDDNLAALGNPLNLTMLSPTVGDDSVQIQGRVTLSSTIYSAGIVSSSLSFGNRRVGSLQIDLPITPTAVITVSAPITIGLLGPGRHLIEWQVAPNNLPGNTDPAAGYAATTVFIAPDLAADPLRIGFGRMPGSTAPFMMDVTNTGDWPSSGGAVEVYDGLPWRAGTHSLLRLALPSIAPGYTAEISGVLQLAGLPAQSSGLAGIYVRLDADEVIEEINENNNLIAAGSVLVGGLIDLKHRVFLPMIKR